MTSRRQPLRPWFARQSVLLLFVALLGIGLTFMVGPLGCRLLCSDGCCSEDSDCPICIFAHTQAASSSQPVIVAARISSPLTLPALTDSEPRSAGDHRLLPSRAPPKLFSP